MTPYPPDEILSVPAQDFQPLRLGLDDVLPVSMVLLLGYRYRLDPIALRAALRTALQAFPHLGGRLQFTLHPLRAEWVPGKHTVELEWIRAGEPLLSDATDASGAPGAPDSLAGLETLDQDALFARFAPSAAASARSPMQALQAPPLQLRLTELPGSQACVLGVMASHMALDGTGLALFLAHLIAALNGGTAPAVIHDRRCTFPDPGSLDTSLPPHYREVPDLMALMQTSDTLASTRATVFSLPWAGLETLLGPTSLSDAKLFLAAHLSREIAALEPERRTLALWCNARGLARVPRNYTGNAGCYVHLPMAPMDSGDAAGLHQRLKRAVTRRGFAEITDTYTRLKAAEAAGRSVFWEGPGHHLLSLNLVPHVRGAADFGQGPPDYAQLLTRNVSGLRLYSSPDGSRLVVETCLPNDQGARLIASCERLGLSVRVWHRG